MADIDEVCDFLAFTISEYLKPYQPDARPLYPNKLPTAGTIPATLCAAGYPIQTHVMKRLENHLAQVAVFDMKEGTVFPFYNRFATVQNLAEGTPRIGTESFDQTREKKRLAVQLWASTRDERMRLSHIVRVAIGDAYRMHHPDGSLTLLKYIKLESEDFEQMDSVYVRTFTYEADLTIIGPVPAAQIIKVIPTTTVQASVPGPHPMRADQL